MKVSDIIRENAPTQIVINITGGEAQVQPTAPVIDTDAPSQADDLMIPPLQAKLELVKKMAGEESVYDPEPEACTDCGCAPCECEGEDEMSILKRNAGISPLSILASLAAEEDEPYEG